MRNTFTQYEAGLTRLLGQLGKSHPRYADALVYQQRLHENIAQVRLFGNSDALKYERAQIVDALNRLAMETVGKSFNEWCRLPGKDSLLHPAWQRIIGAIIAIVVLAIVIVIVISTRYWSEIRALLPSPTPSPTATSTPIVANLTDARVRFIITLRTGQELDIPTGGTLPLTSGDVMLIEIGVIVGDLPFPHDLTYQYSALRGGIPKEYNGPRASYVAPELPVLDLVTVLIKDPATGDTIIRSIKVVVKEKSS
jgi:hypothetical protein